MALEIGDVVELKSGGAKMTVLDLDPHSTGSNVLCGWHNEAGKGFEAQQHLYPENALILSSEAAEKRMDLRNAAKAIAR